ncbi:MAG: hypothetical protein GX417_06740 [Clostridiales bacterium]|nr:hypothetical protein [Clostridiales bacterium]
MQLAELVRRIRHGEKEAVKELVSAYGSSVYQRALERTNDKEFAREAARQTFGQFVAIVQQQPEDDGWSLWFGDLIERNIATYAQISTDMRTIESELDQEIDTPAPAPAPRTQPVIAAPRPEAPSAPMEYAMPGTYAAPAEPEPAQRKGKEPAREADPEPAATSIRDEIFDEPYRKKEKRKASGHSFTVVLLILVSLLLLWVVAGVAMTMQWIPLYDLGYSWFNAHVFRLF